MVRAAQELPQCSEANEAAAFLDDWSRRTYTDVFEKRGPVEKHFGLARATTLVHFVSGGRFPIFDSRVRRAIARVHDHIPPNTIPWYLDSFRSLFSELAALCKTESDLRNLDKALFSYGSSEKLSLPN
jgi:hypothetical protein